MLIKKQYLAIFAIIFSFQVLALGQDTARTAPATWQVQKYDIETSLPASDKDRFLTSKAVISLKNVSGKPASTLTLRIGTNAEVSGIKINDSVVEFQKSEEKINATTSLQRDVIKMSPVAAGGVTATGAGLG